MVKFEKQILKEFAKKSPQDIGEIIARASLNVEAYFRIFYLPLEPAERRRNILDYIFWFGAFEDPECLKIDKIGELYNFKKPCPKEFNFKRYILN